MCQKFLSKIGCHFTLVLLCTMKFTTILHMIVISDVLIQSGFFESLISTNHLYRYWPQCLVILCSYFTYALNKSLGHCNADIVTLNTSLRQEEKLSMNFTFHLTLRNLHVVIAGLCSQVMDADVHEDQFLLKLCV